MALSALCPFLVAQTTTTTTTTTTVQTTSSPPRVKSFAFSATTKSISALWLGDGLGDNYTAIDLDLYEPKQIRNLTFDLIGATGNTANHTVNHVYSGLALGYNLRWNVLPRGVLIHPVIGYKGLDLSHDFQLQGKGGLVIGAGISYSW